MKSLHAFLILGIIALIVFGNSLQNDFAWDDEYLITNNTHVQNPSIKNALSFFKDNLGKYGEDKNNFYRPLQELSYMIDFSIWGLNPVGYHFTNFMLHLLVTMLVFLLIRELCKDSTAAIFAALLYMVHPIHSEAVTYIAGRADSLVALFMLIALYLYIRQYDTSIMPKNRKTCLTGSYLAFILGLMSKEMAIALPILLIFYDITYLDIHSFKKNIKRYAPYIAIGAGYLILRFTALNFGYSVSDLPQGVGLYERFITFFKILKEYFVIIVFPFHLHMERAVEFAKTFFQINVILPLVLTLAAFSILFYRRIKYRTAFFGMGWFIITLFPLSNIPFPLNASLAEHWLYIPLVGVAITASEIIMWAQKSDNAKKAIAYLAAACIIAYFSIITIRQNMIWRDGVTLYSRAIGYTWDSPRLHYNLGNAYRERGMYTEAIDEYKIALRLDPYLQQAYFNTGLSYVKMGSIDSAIANFKKSIELQPSHFKSYNALGLAYRDKGLLDEAIDEFRRCISISPDEPDSYNNLGDIYFRQKMYSEAQGAFKKAVELRPDYIYAWNNLGVSLIMQQKVDEALFAWKKSLEIDPDQPVVVEYIKRNTK